MASKWPAVKNSAYVFRCVLFAQSDNQIKSNPSLSSGDWKVSIDGGAFANLATLPDVDPDSSVQVKVSLSADEMNGDEIMITAIDAAGDEWHSAAWVIHTVGQTFDTVDGNIDSILTDTGTTLDALLQDIPTTAELATALASADDAVLAAIAALNNLSSAGAQAAAAAALTAYGAATAGNVTNATSPLATGAALAALNNLSAAQVNAEVDAALADYDAPTKAELDSAVAPLALEATLAALNNLDVAALITALETETLPDSYSADGAQPTYAQALLEIRQFLMERGVINTTLTVNKPDGTTPAFTLALDDDANPTSISRVS